MGRLVDIDVRDLLVRQRMTDPQARLGAAARVVNVEDAFALRRDAAIAGQDFVLIDDVITTGSTLAACAKVLRDAGAREVSVATLAREIETASAL
ncbi:MAG: ComF family protein [Thermomicrobiales bacterium]|nr:ComF family protein [Thermomicrobiales bacterium]